mmetsp:Transcript_25433/g.85468  ORF Transcript_25433/g.85468 Transcript_25433/m.85468 type:complete len:412 (+) Transcript_25433:111-1346(+)
MGILPASSPWDRRRRTVAAVALRGCCQSPEATSRDGPPGSSAAARSSIHAEGELEAEGRHGGGAAGRVVVAAAGELERFESAVGRVAAGRERRQERRADVEAAGAHGVEDARVDLAAVRRLDEGHGGRREALDAVRCEELVRIDVADDLLEAAEVLAPHGRVDEENLERGRPPEAGAPDKAVRGGLGAQALQGRVADAAAVTGRYGHEEERRAAPLPHALRRRFSPDAVRVRQRQAKEVALKRRRNGVDDGVERAAVGVDPRHHVVGRPEHHVPASAAREEERAHGARDVARGPDADEPRAVRVRRVAPGARIEGARVVVRDVKGERVARPQRRVLREHKSDEREPRVVRVRHRRDRHAARPRREPQSARRRAPRRGERRMMIGRGEPRRALRVVGEPRHAPRVVGATAVA